MLKIIVLVCFIIACSSLVCGLSKCADSSNSFPKDFLFGTATSAYQVEGAWNVNGKSLSNWDYFVHEHPEYVVDGTTGDIACDAYHKIKEDVQLLKQMGVDFYRFSLSWTRIMPSPFVKITNPDGIRYYNELIDELLKNGIQPMITIFHWDLHQVLQQLGGLTNSLVIEPFVNFARIAFENFGDRVKRWTTFNEPYILCALGYGGKLLVPAYNDSGVADYLCAYNILRAHAKAYHLYNNTFKATQKGAVSINMVTWWYEPATSSPKDIAAAERALEFELGLYAHPIFTSTGDYPEVVKNYVARRSKKEGFFKSRLPQLTKEEIEYIRGTYDYFALNHYSSLVAADKEPDPIGMPSTSKDKEVYTYPDPAWRGTIFPYNHVVPWGFRKLLIWIKERYGNPEIFVTENGYPDGGEQNDTGRIEYTQLYLTELLKAIYEHGVRVQGYTAWSLMDNYEWFQGYTLKYGLYYVNFSDPARPRIPKASVEYYKKVIRTRVP